MLYVDNVIDIQNRGPVGEYLEKSTLISPGEMYVDSLLQIEPNAKIEFLSSGESSVIHFAFGGTIYAPLSKLVLGQDVKIIYGRFLAKDITIHQYSKVFRVDYDPTVSSSYVRR